MDWLRRKLFDWLHAPDAHHFMGFDTSHFVHREDEQDVTEGQIEKFHQRFIELVESMGMVCGGGITPACAEGEETPYERSCCPVRKSWQERTRRD